MRDEKQINITLCLLLKLEHKLRFMKRRFVILPLILISIFISACQNQSQKVEVDRSSQLDSKSHVHASSSMIAAMDGMMKDMHQVVMTENVDVDFALMMKSHHEGAVAMALEELKSGKDERVKQMARKIADAQNSEIKALNLFTDKHKNAEENYQPSDKEKGFGKVMNKSMAMMMDLPPMDKEAGTDEQFVALMIPHHQSAVYMAEAMINYGKDVGLIKMAKKMIADQSKEIDEFKSWQGSGK